MWIGERAVWVCGAAPLAERIQEGLRREGQRVRPVTPERLGRLGSKGCRTLILVQGTETPELIRGLRERPTRGGRRGEPLRVILVHAADPPPKLPADLADPDPEGPLRLETFALEDGAARVLLARWPLHFGLDPRFGQRPHLLIVGFAPPARAFLLQALRLIHYGEERGRITVACADAGSVAERFAQNYPQAGQVAEILWHDLDPFLDPEPPATAQVVAGKPPLVTQVLVCVDPPQLGLDLARRVAARLARVQGTSPPILLEVGDTQSSGGIEGWDCQTFPFSYLHEVCRPQVLLDGKGDRLAQTIHEHYTDSIAAQGRDPKAEPAGRPWSRLAGTYRDANRRQADHLGAKLAVTDCEAVPEERVESFAFAPLEAERLAVIEHLRWAADRYLDGWTYAPRRDNALKHHPQLIPYPDLSEPMKDLDRYAVRGVPALLARSGLGVVRILLLGLPEPTRECPGGMTLRRLTDEALERLVARYPDRALVIASTLAEPRSRLVVSRALERTDACLYLLCPQPIDEVLHRQPDDRGRRDLLELASRAKRRIPLAGHEALQQWFSRRAEIILAVGAGATAARARKQVLLDPARGRLEWGFEY